MEAAMTILIATDGSDGAKAAVGDGLRLARRLDAEVLFVAVQHPPRPPFGVPPYYIADPDAHHYAVATIEAALAEARDHVVPARGEVLTPSLDPAHEILEAAVIAGHHDERDESLREQLAAFLHERHPRTANAPDKPNDS